MENFLLNLFSDQLSKVILNYNDAKLKINANFLSGKGSITNVRLNVDAINGFLNKPPYGSVPFLKFTEITLSKLRIEVTSYTNIKKSPVVLVIEEIHAKAVEPLEYYYDATNTGKNGGAGDSQPSSTKGAAPASATSQQSAPNNQPRQPYGLLHRIVDNLSVRINRVNVTFQTLGKLKTRRWAHDLWTPPPIVLCFENLEWISVTESGEVGTPEMVWAHNDFSFQQINLLRKGIGSGANDRHHRSFTIYKRLSMLCHVKLIKFPNEEQLRDSSTQSPPASSTGRPELECTLISNAEMNVHLAYVRRLCNAAVTGVDVDVMVRDVQAHLDLHPKSSFLCDVTAPSGPANSSSSMCEPRVFFHAVAGLQHCLCKDRTFVDPLLPEGKERTIDESTKLSSNFISVSSVGESSSNTVVTVKSNDWDEDPAGPDTFLPGISLVDSDSDSDSLYGNNNEVDLDEEQDEAFLTWKREQEQMQQSDETRTDINLPTKSDQEKSKADPLQFTAGKPKEVTKAETDLNIPDNDGEKENTPKYRKKRRPVLVLATGAQKFEKLSFSLSVGRLNLKLYQPDNDFFQSEGEQPQPHQQSEIDSSPDGIISSYWKKRRFCFEFLIEGFTTECIWPKVSGEMGGHFQSFFSYIHLLEWTQELRTNPNKKDSEKKQNSFAPWAVVKLSPLLRIGKKLFRGHDVFSMSSCWKGSWYSGPFVANSEENEAFPMMEERPTTWKRSNPLKGQRAMALKSTLSFVDETLTLWSQTNVFHEASLSEIEIVLDSSPLSRIAKLFCISKDQHNSLYDERWYSGDWSKVISIDTIAIDEIFSRPNSGFYLKNHLQPLPTWFHNGKIPALSSDLRTVTARLGSIIVRIPNSPLNHNSFNVTDICVSIPKTTILVSSDLPKSFLSGTWVSAHGTAHKDFPNDPSDSSLSDITAENSSKSVTKFRMKIILSNFSVGLTPNHAIEESEANPCGYLIAPTNVTMLLSSENKNDVNALAGNNSSDRVSFPQGLKNACRTWIVSMLFQRIEFNAELYSILSALDIIKLHALRLNSKRTQHSGENSVEEHTSKSEGDTDFNEQPLHDDTCLVCVHVPELEVNVRSRFFNSIHSARKTSSIASAAVQGDFLQLCRLRIQRIELGFEYVWRFESVNQAHSSVTSQPTQHFLTVQKCAIASLSIEVCSACREEVALSSTTESSNCGDQSEEKQLKSGLNLVEVLSLTNEASGLKRLGDEIEAYVSSDVEVKQPVESDGGLFFRSDYISACRHPRHSEKNVSLVSFSVHIASTLVVSLNLHAFEHFLDVLADSLSEPMSINFGTNLGNDEQESLQLQEEPSLSNPTLGAALASAFLQIQALCHSFPVAFRTVRKNYVEPSDSLYRLFIHRLLILLPHGDTSDDQNSFGLLVRGLEVAVGQFHCKTTDSFETPKLLHSTERYCGPGGRTWDLTFNLSNKGPPMSTNTGFNTCYLINSNYTLLNILGSQERGHVLIPTSSWSFGPSWATEPNSLFVSGLIDLDKLKKLYASLSSIVGAIASYSKLSRSLPHQISWPCDFSSNLRRLYCSIKSYHDKICRSVNHMTTEIETLRQAVFVKERERLAALLLASSSMSGWVRVGEGSSFPHRIFSSATFWRYWMVLKRSLIILYQAPGITNPSFIIPLEASTQLRNVAISSSSDAGKTAAGIVSCHIAQNGFSLVEQKMGTELFFITTNQADYQKWVSAISNALKTHRLHQPGGSDLGMVDQQKEQSDSDTTEMGSPAGQLDSPDYQTETVHSNVAKESNLPLDDHKTGEGDESELGRDKYESAVMVPEPDESITDLDMETIALIGHSAKHSDKVSHSDSNADSGSRSETPSFEQPSDKLLTGPISDSAESVGNLQKPNQKDQPPNDLLSTRSRFVKGKGRFVAGRGAKSMLGSALKSAKGGVMAASELSREGIKQALTKEDPLTPLAKTSDQKQLVESSRTNDLRVESGVMVENSGAGEGAKSRFGSALKTARGGVLAVGEKSREGLKQALAKETLGTPLGIVPDQQQRMGNQPNRTGLWADIPSAESRVSTLRKNANSKLASFGTAVRLSVNGPIAAGEYIQGSGPIYDEQKNEQNKFVSSNPSLVKAHRSSIDAEMSESNRNDVVSGFHELDAVQGSGKQEVRHKFANFDHSVSNTMRRLKIDEKITQFSSAVKNVKMDSQVIKQLSTGGLQYSKSENFRTRIGIGEETESTKSVKFDARETFSTFSSLPTKLKSIQSGNTLASPSQYSQKKEVLGKMNGNWAVSVETAKSPSPGLTTDAINTSNAAYSFENKNEIQADSYQAPLDCSKENGQHQLIYEIKSSQLDFDLVAKQQSSVQRSISDVLIFHSLISEILSRELSCKAGGVGHSGYLNFNISGYESQDTVSFDHIRACGMLLQCILDAQSPFSKSSSTVKSYHCKLIEMFINILLESNLPSAAISATEQFLGITSAEVDCSFAQDQKYFCLENGRAFLPCAHEVMHIVSNFETSLKSQQSIVNHDHKAFSDSSPPHKSIMNRYSELAKERDEALASLAAASTFYEHHVIQENIAKQKKTRSQYLGETNRSGRGLVLQNNDQDMLNLCEQLGCEIAARTAAELEITRMKECLRLERELTKRKEQELLAQITKYRKDLEKNSINE